MPQDFIVDLPVGRQLLVIHLLGQLVQSILHVFQPTPAGLGRKIVQQVVKTMIAQLRGVHGPKPKCFFQVLLEKGVELCIGLLAVTGRKSGR